MGGEHVVRTWYLRTSRSMAFCASLCRATSCSSCDAWQRDVMWCVM